MNAFFLQYRHPLLFAILAAVLASIVWLTLWPDRLTISTRETISAAAANIAIVPPVETPPTFPYIQIINSCDIHYAGDCVVARTRPATTSPVVLKLRNGIVLSVASTTTTDETGRVWYHIIFDEEVRYTERIASNWYVAADNVRTLENAGVQTLLPHATITPSTKHIIIDRSEQKLYAYDGDTLFLETLVSTGLDLTPTPRGFFHIYKKTPTRYMQGPLLGISDQYYDLPGVPWDLYFTADGGAIHGTYWHDSFGQEWSHGCVNLPVDTAEKLYNWADLGIEVLVQD